MKGGVNGNNVVAVGLKEGNLNLGKARGCLQWTSKLPYMGRPASPTTGGVVRARALSSFYSEG